MGMHHGRALAITAVADRPGHGRITRNGIAAVHFLYLKIRHPAHALGDAPPRRLHLDGYRDGVAVVLDDIHDGKLQIRCRIDRLPELAFAGRTVAGTHHDDLIPFEQVVAFFELIYQRKAVRSLGAPDGVQELRTGRAGAGHDVVVLVSPVAGHLPSTRGRILLGAHALEQHLVRRHSQLETEGTVAIVRVEPVVGGTGRQTRRDPDGLVAGAADLEEVTVLSLELDLFVVQPARQIHGPVNSDQLVGPQTLVLPFGCID